LLSDSDQLKVDNAIEIAWCEAINLGVIVSGLPVTTNDAAALNE
jgi:hypothetical protein